MVERERAMAIEAVLANLDEAWNAVEQASSPEDAVERCCEALEAALRSMTPYRANPAQVAE